MYCTCAVLKITTLYIQWLTTDLLLKYQWLWSSWTELLSSFSLHSPVMKWGRGVGEGRKYSMHVLVVFILYTPTKDWVSLSTLSMVYWFW